MAPSTPLLTVRGSEGLYMVNGPPHFTESTVFPRDRVSPCCPAGLELLTSGDLPASASQTAGITGRIWEELQSLYL
ncbi:EIF2A isoform 11 [Pongo abelii]|uniref:EIF2A isoform 11 n=1 Tax=Pongo abelii TaxID=9601 RepID=A0A2J8WT24_PONAB|nr:EIF2A isoform 11 [Pongo abelii]